MNPTTIAILYVLILALAFGLSKLCGDSRAGKMARHAFNVLTLGLVEAAKYLVGKIKGQ